MVSFIDAFLFKRMNFDFLQFPQIAIYGNNFINEKKIQELLYVTVSIFLSCFLFDFYKKLLYNGY
jgi:hypothetical protein